MDGIGPGLPLHRDDRFGHFSLVTNYAEQVKQNFKNLLLTAPGERVMLPAFGVGLRNFLFESHPTAVSSIRQRIEAQVSRYMPFIIINKMQFNHNIDPDETADLNILSILIEYHVPSLNLASSLVIQSEDIN